MILRADVERERVAVESKIEEVDLIVLGGGPGGQRAAVQAAKKGARVVIVDRKYHMGGVCLHTGTIPSKTLREAVMYLCGLRQTLHLSDKHRVKPHISLPDLMDRVNRVLLHEMSVVEAQLMRNKVQTLAVAGRVSIGRRAIAVAVAVASHDRAVAVMFGHSRHQEGHGGCDNSVFSQFQIRHVDILDSFFKYLTALRCSSQQVYH